MAVDSDKLYEDADWFFSRSHQSALHQCPRLAWLTYYDEGHGWESAKLNLEQATGSLAHAMLEGILHQIKDIGTWGYRHPDAAVFVQAIDDYKRECSKRGFDLDAVGDLKFELIRQSTLAEGMVRAWVKLRLPQLLERFRVVAVEEEWDVPLLEEVEGQSNLLEMVRLDALLEDRSNQELWPLEFKTTGFMSDDWLESWRYSSQTLQQVWAAERHLGKFAAGVQLEALYKGVKRRDEVTGAQTYYSPFVRAYLKRGVPPFDEDELSWDSKNARRKDWEAVDAWTWMAQTGKPYSAWFEQIPDDVLQAQLFNREIFRSGKEQEQWLRQTIAEQRRIARGVQAVESASDKQKALEVHFPARLDEDCYSNKFRRRCRFLDVCFNDADPADSDLFRVREPHHPQESED